MTYLLTHTTLPPVITDTPPTAAEREALYDDDWDIIHISDEIPLIYTVDNTGPCWAPIPEIPSARELLYPTTPTTPE